MVWKPAKEEGHKIVSSDVEGKNKGETQVSSAGEFSPDNVPTLSPGQRATRRQRREQPRCVQKKCHAGHYFFFGVWGGPKVHSMQLRSSRPKRRA
jgi:hypothetical protein